MYRFEAFLWELTEAGRIDGQRYALLVRSWYDGQNTTLAILNWLEDCRIIPTLERLTFLQSSACNEATIDENETVAY